MLKIGMVDYWLDNWHANYYPGFLRETAKKFNIDADVTMAWAKMDRPGGIANEKWCAERNIALIPRLEDLISQVDALMIIAADDSNFHEEISILPFKSGKPVYADKTFMPDPQTALKMFTLAADYHTPVFSCSAQRYCQSLLDYQNELKNGMLNPPGFISTVGPGDLSNYSVHQLEVINAVMGTGIQRLKCFPAGDKITNLLLDYGDGRTALFTQTPNPYAEFNFMVSDGQTGRRLASEAYYENLMRTILTFYADQKIPVAHKDTLEIINIIALAKKARDRPDEWFSLQPVSGGFYA